MRISTLQQCCFAQSFYFIKKTSCSVEPSSESEWTLATILAGQPGLGLMWGEELLVMDSRTQGEQNNAWSQTNLKHLSLFINSQYRSLMSVNKPPPGKNWKVHAQIMISRLKSMFSRLIFNEIASNFFNEFAAILSGCPKCENLTNSRIICLHFRV